MSSKVGPALHRLGLIAGLSVIGGLLAALAALPAVGGAGLLARSAAKSFNSLPANLVVQPLEQRSVLRAADGSVLAVLRGPQDRVAVPLYQIPLVMQQAIVAIEDDRFYEDNGIDIRGIVRAVVRNGQSGGITQGASTLTQQYVKNVLVQQEGAQAATARTLQRKLQEARYALALAHTLSKAQILQGYLNIAYFGEGVYGVATAAGHYFGGEPVTALTLPQAALLAGMVEDPSLFDPVLHPVHARDRRDTVLARMAQLHYINASTAAAAERTPLALHPQTHSLDPCQASRAPFFCDYAVQQLLADPALGATPAERRRAVFEGGLDITTTLDPATQAAAQSAVDLIPHDNRAVDPIAMVKPGTGAVLAMAVNRDYGSGVHTPTASKFPYITQPFSQPGSSFKLFTLAAALSEGVPTSTTLFAPPCYVPPPNEPAFAISGGLPGCANGYRNADPTEGGTFDMAHATWYSVNTWFIQLEERVGLARVKAAAVSLGIPERLVADAGGSLTLGGLAYGVSPLEMARAYAAIAAHGLYCPSKVVTRILGPTHAPVPFTSPGPCRQVVDPKVADTITSLLTGVITQPGGTGNPNAQIGRPAAGKTGTNTNFMSAWFVGYTPDLAAAVALADPRGNNPAYELRNFCIPSQCVPNVYGGTLPALVWAQAMRGALANTPPDPFVFPDGVDSTGRDVALPDVSGQLPAQAQAVLQGDGLAVTVSPYPVPVAGIAAGLVAYTDPSAGTQVPVGSQVTLFVSNGQAPNVAPTPAGPVTVITVAPPGPAPAPSPSPSPPPRNPKH